MAQHLPIDRHTHMLGRRGFGARSPLSILAWSRSPTIVMSLGSPCCSNLGRGSGTALPTKWVVMRSISSATPGMARRGTGAIRRCSRRLCARRPPSREWMTWFQKTRKGTTYKFRSPGAVDRWRSPRAAHQDSAGAPYDWCRTDVQPGRSQMRQVVRRKIVTNSAPESGGLRVVSANSPQPPHRYGDKEPPGGLGERGCGHPVERSQGFSGD